MHRMTDFRFVFRTLQKQPAEVQVYEIRNTVMQDGKYTHTVNDERARCTQAYECVYTSSFPVCFLFFLSFSASLYLSRQFCGHFSSTFCDPGEFIIRKSMNENRSHRACFYRVLTQRSIGRLDAYVWDEKFQPATCSICRTYQIYSLPLSYPCEPRTVQRIRSRTLFLGNILQ